MEINFQCTKNDFQNIEMFLFSQEYLTKPEFDKIKLKVDNKENIYIVENQFDKWYITTN